MKKGIIVLGHGSKADEANKAFIQLSELFKQRNPEDVVEPAFLQLSPPDLATAMEKVVAQGVKRVIICPVFLFPGNHIREDIPAELDQERAKYPDVEIIMADHIGVDERILAILTDRVEEACA